MGTLYVTTAIALVSVGIPHLLRLDDAPPALAAAIWFVAVAMRAVLAVFAAIFVVLYLPATELFRLISHWCLDAVVPFFTSHFPINGHAIGDAAIIAPSAVLALSVFSVAVGLFRAARAVGQLLSRGTIARGPRDSVVLGDRDVLIAAAGLRRPRVVVSAGALVMLDDQELEASLDHEQGHIHRGHRFVIVAAQLCRALGRFIPGSSTAATELLYHLERDADAYALARSHEAPALASAICKAATARAQHAPAAFALSGGPAVRRVTQLLEGTPPVSRSRRWALRSYLVASAATLSLAVGALPAAAEAGLDAARSGVPAHSCDHK